MTEWEKSVRFASVGPRAVYSPGANRVTRTLARRYMSEVIGQIGVLFQQKYRARVRAATPEEIQRLLIFLEEED